MAHEQRARARPIAQALYRYGHERLGDYILCLGMFMAEKMSGTSVKIIKNEVGCRDDTMPKTIEQEGSARIESMQQSFTTPSLHLGFWGLRKIVACSQSSHCLLVSIVFGTVSSLHPTCTSFLMIFTLV